jgi:antitoxin component YwqK of YwqJK toxin-antitoxin module
VGKRLLKMANTYQKPIMFGKSKAICITFSCFVLFSCEKPQVQKQEKGYPLADIIQEQSYWEGSSIEATDTFFMDDENMFCFKETKRPYTGVIKVRARNGTVAALRSYISGVPDGDFYEWHENGNLKSKQQYKNGVKHGYFFVWTSNNVIYSRRYYQDGMEDFSRFEDEGVAQTGASLASVELKEWQGTGPEFYKKFAGDPKRDGMVWIRETEEFYNGTITALDDQGRKEAVLRFKNGKYQGTISKWNEDGKLWEEGEFDRGILVTFTIKEGKPFDPNQIIDLSEDPEMAKLLFEE